MYRGRRLELDPHIHAALASTGDRAIYNLLISHLRDKSPGIQLVRMWDNKEEKKEENILPDFQHINISGTDTSGVTLNDLTYVSKRIIEALQLREKYMFSSCQSFPKIISRLLQNVDKNPNFKGTREEIKKTNSESKGPNFEKVEHDFRHTWIRMEKGVACVSCNKPMEPHPDLVSFLQDQNFLFELINDGQLRSFCRTRLHYLSTKFNMHILMNTFKESAEQKDVPNRDFFNVIKVDTHVHAAGCINQNDLLEFIQEKINDNECVQVEGKNKTLQQVFKDLHLEVDKLSLDMLDVHADRHVYECFENFNDKYNPFGAKILRNIFFKTDNEMDGKYFAEIFKKVTERIEKSKYQKAEFRLSIYGRKNDEWKKLAKWAKDNNMNSEDVEWIVQVPRLYAVYRKEKKIKNFQEILENIFKPLFEATISPAENEDLCDFLKHVSGIDSVDDESQSEYIHLSKETYTPDLWTSEDNPPYTYYLYYMYVNLAVLNNIRRQLNQKTFTLRPHCGEAGNVTHLVAGFLFAENIAHGLTLNKVPALEYLYYLTQIGIAMSPMSNNALFLKYHSNPLPEYFSRGLNISLSTDDPMQFHLTKEPLIEEYSIASQIWNLSSIDMCEIARNSVLQSGFNEKEKKTWLGQDYTKEGVAGNDVHKTNVPSIRVAYRYDTLVDELVCISRGYLFKNSEQLQS